MSIIGVLFLFLLITMYITLREIDVVSSGIVAMRADNNVASSGPGERIPEM